MARNKHKKKNNNGRNWLAVHAHFKTGAGDHGDKKKHKNKKACRGKVKHENQQLEDHPQQPHRRTGKFKEPSKGSL